MRDLAGLVDADVGGGHAGGPEVVLADVVGVALAGAAFQDRAKHDEAVVAVAKPRAGLELERLLDDPRQLAGDEHLAQRGDGEPGLGGVGQAALPVGHAVALLQQRLAVPGDQDGPGERAGGTSS
jgi:hypothetical protein